MASVPLHLGAFVLALVVAGALSLLILAMDPKRSANRRLALVLGLEATFLAALVTQQVIDGATTALPRWLDTLLLGTVVATGASYLVLLSSLETPLVRVFRLRAARVGLLFYVLALTIGAYLYGSPAGAGDGGLGASIVGIASLATMVGVALFGIVVTVSAWRRTAPGTRARSQAAALLAAFATRDVIWAAMILIGVFAPESVGNYAWNLGPPLSILLYVPILAYGLLREQVFDIDLKIKVGISRSTVATIGLVVVLAAAKVAEFYLNKTFGFIAGGIAAGVLLVLAPRLNRLGDRVAATALPKVQETPAYVQFRKLEVYKTALESAHEDGAPTPKELATLEKLRLKLGILDSDKDAIEADVRAALGRA